jgi:hypothetical protein
MRIKRSLVVGLTAAAALAVPATSSAMTQVIAPPAVGGTSGVTSFTVHDNQTGVFLGLSVFQTAQAQNLGNPLSTTRTNMALECAANATAGASTAIVQCYIEGLHNGQRYHAIDTGAKPGTTDAEVNVPNAVNQPYRACVQTRVFLRDGETQYDEDLQCGAV